MSFSSSQPPTSIPEAYNDQRVAIIGGGPAGLMAAEVLVEAGMNVDVYYAMPTLGRKFLKTTILENNIIQTTGSAGESIAAGVAFTLPGFLFLSPGENGWRGGEADCDERTILILAAFGGMLGTLMMIPLRR